MKHMISWFERPQGSPAEYENAQKRILEVFGQWKAPAGFKIELFERLGGRRALDLCATVQAQTRGNYERRTASG